MEDGDGNAERNKGGKERRRGGPLPWAPLPRRTVTNNYRNRPGINKHPWLLSALASPVCHGAATEFAMRMKDTDARVGPCLSSLNRNRKLMDNERVVRLRLLDRVLPILLRG